MNVHLENLGSLITYRKNGKDHCLGDLFNFSGHGVYDPDLGKVDVTPEQAEQHNKCFSQAKIDGLDKCKIGQCGLFYPSRVGEEWDVRTWQGQFVAKAVRIPATALIEFERKGKVFRGSIRRGDDQSVLFKRIK